MRKSILVTNTPECCEECNFMRNIEYGKFACFASDYVVTIPILTVRPIWCPLKPLPEKEEDWMDDYYRGHADGWNDCLYKITGDIDVLC